MPGLTRAGLLAAGLYVAAFVGLSAGAAQRSRVGVLIAAACLVGAALLLQLILSRARRDSLLSRRARLGIPLLIMAVGAGLGLWWLTRHPTGGWGLAGLCALYLGAGQALAEWRSRTSGAPSRGVWLSAGSAALFALGIILCLVLSSWFLVAAAVGLLAAPVGLTLLSEDVLRLNLWPMRCAALGPFLVVAGGLSLHYLAGVSASWMWALIGALLVLVGAIASSTPADVMLMVTVIALIWAGAPRADSVGTPASVSPALVALGDSYISGEGAKEFFAATNVADENECRRAPSAYPVLVATPARLAFFACSGAVAANIYRRPQWPGEPVDDTPQKGVDQLDQLKALFARSGRGVRLVLVSIGGNDAGFSTIGVSCLAPGSCVERGQAWFNRLTEDVAPEVGRAYRTIRAVTGGRVPVVAVPYPEPISDHPCAYSSLTAGEGRFLRAFLRELNAVIRRSARDAGFYYLPAMQGAFSDSLRICDQPRDKVGVNFISLRSVDGFVDQALNPAKWIHNSLHPNEAGHRAMAAVLESWLRAHRDLPVKPDPRDRPVPAPARLSDVMHGAHAYCGGPGAQPHYCSRDDVAWTLTKLTIGFGRAALPALLVVAGWWLLCLPVLARTRPRGSRLGDRIAGRVLASCRA
jgi:lysophospholipase L1-like esterase